MIQNRESQTPVAPDSPDVIDEAELPSAPSDRASRALARMGFLLAPLAVGIGGALGAILRYQVSLWSVGQWGDQFPWGTLFINVTGCVVIGFYLTLVTERLAGRPVTRLFVATGTLGGYTTFSAFAYETISLVSNAQFATAVTYVVASLTLSIVGVLAGVLAARAL